MTNAKKQAATTKATSVHNTGAHIENVHIENKAAPVSDKAAEALMELAKASAAHAQAISDIAAALRGSEARMTTGIALSHVAATH